MENFLETHEPTTLEGERKSIKVSSQKEKSLEMIILFFKHSHRLASFASISSRHLSPASNSLMKLCFLVVLLCGRENVSRQRPNIILTDAFDVSDGDNIHFLLPTKKPFYLDTFTHAVVNLN